jgi:hypothetical protein
MFFASQRRSSASPSVLSLRGAILPEFLGAAGPITPFHVADQTEIRSAWWWR